MKDCQIVLGSGVVAGGLRANFAGFASAFRDHGMDVTVFASEGEQRPGLRYELETRGIVVLQEECFALSSLSRARQACHNLLHHLKSHSRRNHRIVLLGGSLREALLFGYLKPQLMVPGTEIWSCIQIYSLHHQSRLWPFYYAVGAQLYHLSVDQVFAPCRIEQKKLITLGLPARMCEIVHLPISTELLHECAAPSHVTQELLGKLGGGPTLIFLVNFYRTKGQEILIKMMKILKKEVDNINLILAGEGPYKPFCHGLARDIGVEDRIKFPGRLPQSDLPYLLKAVTMAVVGSYTETFGYCIAEPLLWGVPVVSSHVGIACELKLLGAIRTFPPHDYREAAHQVLQYLRDPIEARRSALVGQHYIRTTCLPHAVASRMLASWSQMEEVL